MIGHADDRILGMKIDHIPEGVRLHLNLIEARLLLARDGHILPEEVDLLRKEILQAELAGSAPPSTTRGTGPSDPPPDVTPGGREADEQGKTRSSVPAEKSAPRMCEYHADCDAADAEMEAACGIKALHLTLD